MVAAVRSASPSFSSSSLSPFFVIHRPNWARLQTIPPSRRKHAILAYNALSAHADGATGTTFISYATIAREGCMARSTAIEAVRTLAEYGLVTITARRDPHGDRATNLYTLQVIPAVTSAPPGGPPRPRGVIGQADPIEKGFDQELKERAMLVESTPPPISHAEPTTKDAPKAWIIPLARDLRRQIPDKASERATAGRLRNVYRQSGLSRDAFLGASYEARARTMQRSGGMAYWFQVLADVLTEPGGASPGRTPSRKEAATMGRASRHEEERVKVSCNTTAPIPLDQPRYLSVWSAELVDLGIPNRAAFIRIFGRGPYDSPEETIDYARRRLSGTHLPM